MLSDFNAYFSYFFFLCKPVENICLCSFSALYFCKQLTYQICRNTEGALQDSQRAQLM